MARSSRCSRCTSTTRICRRTASLPERGAAPYPSHSRLAHADKDNFGYPLCRCKCSKGPVVYIYRRPSFIDAVSLCPLSLVRPFVRYRPLRVSLPAPVAPCFVPPRSPLSLRYTETHQNIASPSLQIMDGRRLAPGSHLNAIPAWCIGTVLTSFRSDLLGYWLWHLYYSPISPPFITLPSRNYYILCVSLFLFPSSFLSKKFIPFTFSSSDPSSAFAVGLH